MDKVFISFIVPVFNVEAYLAKCIDSIRKQEDRCWEIILVDDGSTDRSGEICDDYVQIDSRIQVIHQTNSGVASARNQGLDKARGKWVWFVDSDDYIVPGAITRLRNADQRNDCDTIFFGMLEDWNGKISKEAQKRIDITEKPKNDLLENVFCYANPSMLFLRRIIDENNIRFTQGLKMGEDLEFQYKYLIQTEHPIQISDSLYVYQHRFGSAMTNPNTHKNNAYDCIIASNNLLDEIIDKRIKAEHWLIMRLRMLIKSSLQSASHLSYEQLKDYRKLFKNVLDIYIKFGYEDVIDKTIRIARFSLNLYFVLLRIYLKKNATVKSYS